MAETHPDDPVVPLKLLTNALDEIYSMRGFSAHAYLELRELLDLKTLPVHARETIRDLLDHLHDAAGGEAQVWVRVPNSAPFHGKRALQKAGVSDTLTRSSWETAGDAIR